MWQVIPSRDVSKAIGRLPKPVQERAFTLIKEIEVMGPVRGGVAELRQAFRE